MRNLQIAIAFVLLAIATANLVFYLNMILS